MKKLIILLISISVFSSCEDILGNFLDDKVELEVNVDIENDATDDGEENPESPLPVTEFKSEEDMKEAVNDIYVSLYDYINIQKDIEKSIIIAKDFDSVTSTNSIYEQGWNAAYETIGKGNLCIRSLERAAESFGQQTVEKYLAETFALMGFIYKNLFEHWGNVPIIAPATPLEGMLITSHEYEVMNYAIEMLETARSIFEQGDNTASTDILLKTVYLALAETCGYYDYNKGLECCMKIAELISDKEIVFELAGPSGNIVIYTADNAKLYQSELSFILGRLPESGINDLRELLDKWSPLSYGYWSMLKRTKLFTETLGCQEYMQYLPIPLKILESNPEVMQNPGY